jgi:RHS repeat-associated protein
MKERFYLGGFEIFREYAGNGSTVTLERETLHIMDDKQRIALVETRTRGSDGSPGQLSRYQFGNHLGSTSLELDDQAQIVSSEEYFPYGSTSYQTVRSRMEAPKRYRYTGKERDEESGFGYFGLRYYAFGLSRWISADPASLKDGLNVYSYTRANPIAFIDRMGTNREPPILDALEMIKRDATIFADAVERRHQFDSADPTILLNYPQWRAMLINLGMRSLDACYTSDVVSDEELFDMGAKAFALSNNLMDVYTDAGARGEQQHQKMIDKQLDKPGYNLLRNMSPEEQNYATVNAVFGVLASMGGRRQGKTSGSSARRPSSRPVGRGRSPRVPLASKPLQSRFKPRRPAAGQRIFSPGFKQYWNKQETQAAEFVWRTEGAVWRREAWIWIMKDGKMIKTQRRLDAVLFQTTGKVEAVEWSTPRNLEEGAAKQAQLQYQQEIFALAKQGWRILARPEGESVYYDITGAAQRTEVYPHWRRP